MPAASALVEQLRSRHFPKPPAFVQNDEAEDEEMAGEESGNDGFFVSDGQLSEDEGLSSAQQDIDLLCAGQEGQVLGCCAYCLVSRSRSPARVSMHCNMPACCKRHQQSGMRHPLERLDLLALFHLLCPAAVA